MVTTVTLCDLSGCCELNVHCRMRGSKSYDPQPTRGAAQKKKAKVQQKTIMVEKILPSDHHGYTCGYTTWMNLEKQ